MTKVLLVTPHIETFNGLETLLQQEGFSVSVATEVEIALASVHKDSPNLILCKADAPLFNGHQFLQILRDCSLGATIPFIFLAATITESMRRHGMNLGADDYLTFPGKVDDLMTSIHCRLARQKACQQREAERLEELRRNLTIALPHELRTPLQGIITSAELLSEYWQTLEQDFGRSSKMISVKHFKK